MNVLKLIELVRSHPELYDSTQANYMDINYKEQIWNKIGREMNTSGVLCKSRWNNIRDNYRKSLKKVLFMKDGQVTRRCKVYKFSNELSFLKKYFTQKSRKRPLKFKILKIDPDEQPNENELSNQMSLHESVQNENENSRHSSISIIGTKLIDDNEIQIQAPPENSSVLNSSNYSAANTSPTETLSSTLLRYLINQKEKESNVHPIDTFLSGISSTLKSLTPYLLNLAKSDIFSIVQKYELQMLQEQQDNQPADERYFKYNPPAQNSELASSSNDPLQDSSQMY